METEAKIDIDRKQWRETFGGGIFHVLKSTILANHETLVGWWDGGMGVVIPHHNYAENPAVPQYRTCYHLY